MKEKIEKSGGIEELLQGLLIVELYKLGVPQTEIGKRLKLRTVVVNSLLKGIKINK